MMIALILPTLAIAQMSKVINVKSMPNVFIPFLMMYCCFENSTEYIIKVYNVTFKYDDILVFGKIGPVFYTLPICSSEYLNGYI